MKIVLGLLLFSQLAFAKAAPHFSADILGGGKFNLTQSLKPGRAMLVSFWASWCVPCIQELTLVKEKLAKENLPLDVVAINVDTNETISDVKPTIRHHKITFPVLLDTKREIFAQFQQADSLPYSVLISSNGEIQKTFSGFHESMFDDVKKIIGSSK
jgi:thiol-disulfide isomerase/thioredoxin